MLNRQIFMLYFRKIYSAIELTKQKHDINKNEKEEL